MFAPRTRLGVCVEAAPALRQPAVDGGVCRAGELRDLRVAEASGLQEQLAALARTGTFESPESIGVFLERDQSIDGIARQSLRLEQLTGFGGGKEAADGTFAAGQACE